MLAYVFWHWPRVDVAREEYEERLRAFHAGLREAPPTGMRSCHAFRVEGAPWLAAGRGYEDWYLLDGTAALETIGREAVSGQLGKRHDAAAGMSAGGTAGLYRPARGAEGALAGDHACWFTKPPGMSHEDVFARVGGPAVALWMRMLVLGPTLEFCLLGVEETEAPDGWDVVRVRREGMW